MPRYKLIIEYDGGCFYGWQRQPGLKTVQGTLEKAITKFCGEEVVVHGAGRTDAGVHALGQTAHVELTKQVDAFRLMEALNGYCRKTGLSVVASEAVADDFHARFSAIGRQYCYRIINRRPALTIDANRAWHILKPLDVEAMQEAGSLFLGTHDFTSFRSINCQASATIKTIDAFTVEKQGNVITLRVRSRSFLHNQVRIMVGSLVFVGRGQWQPDDIKIALEAKHRVAAGPTAPAEGLYFEQVYYS